jgi:ATP-dependent Zn protease
VNSYNLNVIQDTLNKVHPKQIINKIDNLNITMFKVTYEYITVRNNKKQGEKYFLLNTLNPQADLKNELNKWTEDYNENNKHRQISNVKFLESQCLGYLSI